MNYVQWGQIVFVEALLFSIFMGILFHEIFFKNFMKSQNEYMKSSHCPKYERNIREISALEGTLRCLTE